MISHSYGFFEIHEDLKKFYPIFEDSITYQFNKNLSLSLKIFALVFFYYFWLLLNCNIKNFPKYTSKISVESFNYKAGNESPFQISKDSWRDLTNLEIKIPQ